ncbi:MAG TPA: MBL fold metallo-hydrolase [Gemmatimonadaceae bacterium]|nr:MBL fold metallo-hydrolase [Gemmatimonadaceae bacterium]
MVRSELHDDVTRLVLSSRVSRAFGYDVSVFVTRGILIDTGFRGAAGELAAILDAMRIQGVVLTHHHEDHAGNLSLVAERGLPVAVADDTLAAVRALPPLGAIRRAMWGTPAPLRAAPRPFAPDALRLIPTPGHASDHHVVWDAERETLFAGDLFLGVKVRMAHADEDPRTLARSLRAAAALEPKRMFDAHRGLVTDAAAALRSKADWLEDTIGDIERRLDAGWSERATARAVLGREPLAYYVSLGALSAVNLVRAVRRAGGAEPSHAPHRA